MEATIDRSADHWLSLAASEIQPDTYTRVEELCLELFASLPRRDQRLAGRQYLHGLLSTDGRKSVRRMSLGDQPVAQSLHHFVTSSTWDWNAVRAALARCLQRVIRPQAWVVQQLIIPKYGSASAGVAERFVPSLGRVVKSQEAMGLWAANGTRSCPVNWQLMLSEQQQGGGRCEGTSGRIPAGALAGTRLTGVLEGLQEVQDWVGRSALPLVLELPHDCQSMIAHRLSSRDVPFISAVHGTLLVTNATRGLLVSNERELTAHALLSTARKLPPSRRQTGRGVSAPLRSSPEAGVRIRLEGVDGPLVLIGERGAGTDRPGRYWISNLTRVPKHSLLRLAGMVDRVEADFTNFSLRSGMIDYTGRSFEGWHRHTTMASAAHAVHLLSELDDGRSLPSDMAAGAFPGVTINSLNG